MEVVKRQGVMIIYLNAKLKLDVKVFNTAIESIQRDLKQVLSNRIRGSK